MTIRGNGKGGRNQEFVLAAAIDMAGLDEVRDIERRHRWQRRSHRRRGRDGRRPDLERPRSWGTRKEYLANNDSYHYFKPLDDLVITGPTNTNVMDVRLISGRAARRAGIRKLS